MDIIKMNGVNKSFKSKHVLKNLNLTVGKGECIYIHGINGSGKSTILKIIAGIETADSGEVWIDSSENLGALIENPEFAPYSTLKENLELLGNIKGKFDSTYAEELCQRFELDYNDKSFVNHYSVGMKQKLGIIQAVMENQTIVLFDEPTRGLDVAAVKTFYNLCHSLMADGKTLVICSHERIDLTYTHEYKLVNGYVSELEKVE